MRNDWFPRRIAEYVTLPERKTMRAKGVAAERDFDFGLASNLSAPSAPAAAADTPSSMTATAKQEASMFQRRTLDPARLTPERSLELLEIFVPSRGLEFYRQPIIEESPQSTLPPPMEPKKPARSFGFGAGAELMAARAQQAEYPVKPKVPDGPQAIYGSVSTHDVLVAIRAAMAENDEARTVVLREDDVRFVDLVADETDRVKHVGDFKVEIKVKGAEGGVKRNVRIIAQEVA